MNVVLGALLIAIAPSLALAQGTTAKPAARAAAKAPAKPSAARSPAAKPVPLAPATADGTRPTIRKRGGAVVPKTLEESINVDDDPAVKLTPADLEVARKIHIGDIPCELGATVHVTQHKQEGFFIVRAGLQRFRMHPVESKTGAIRLEDPVGGAMWLQLANKSMLMSQKLGRRLADECVAPPQAAVAEAMKRAPAAPGLLDPLPLAAPAVAQPVIAPPEAAVPPAAAMPAVPASR
ncbi:MAG: hypothetical protein Q8R63_01100 [Ramlibacter sp.]|nr:hypothetical protein [Ramlibacter sp.]